MVHFSWFRSKSARRPAACRRRRSARAPVETLEDRLLLTTYTPAQIAHAYGVDQIMFGSVKGDGSGQTIAIVDAYDAPNIAGDLQKFDAIYGLPDLDGNGDFALTKATPQGTPAYDAGWAQEITLDVQWAHAIAPGAHILLVEAASSSYNDLMAAVDYARNQPGVSTVSMSWGGTEFSSESAYDSIFTTPAGHQGISFFASAGDTGAVTEYPAASPNVVGVGGTTLTTVGSSGAYGGETTWTGSGGGISAYEPKPAFQAAVTQSATRRTTPDVSLDANPNTGVAVYFTDSTGTGALYTFGGTSISSPQWAAMVAIADQGRALQGLDSLDGPSQLLPALYSLPATDFHDVTQGTAGSGRNRLSAGAGYDLVTGLGSPVANLLIPDLVSVSGTGVVTPHLPEVGSVAVSAQSGSLVYGTAGTTTYTVTVNRASAGAFDADLSLATVLPSGATWFFTVGGTVTNTLHFGDADQSLTVTLTIVSGATTSAGAFDFTVKAERIDSGGDPTGDQATSSGSLSLAQRVLDVTALGVSKVYDGSTTATVTFSDDRVSGDSLTITYASAVFSDANAGTDKQIVYSGLALSGPDAANYQLLVTSGLASADVTQRQITVTADPKSKIIGDSDPPLTFRVTSGSLVAGDTFSGFLVRTPGEDVGAYSILQWTLSAGTNYQLTFVGNVFTIQPFGADTDLTGPWAVGGQLAQITQTGSSLTFVDPSGTSSTGSFTAKDQITGLGGLSGTIDITTADKGRIVWSDGTTWLKISLGGQYYNPANGGLTSVAQSGFDLTFTNVAGGTTTGSVLSPTQVSLPGWGQTATFENGMLLMSGGSSWFKLDLSPAYATSNGNMPVSVLQDGTTTLTFVNRMGQTSSGWWTSPTTLFASDWNSTATVADGRIVWNGGQTVWSKNLQVFGASSAGPGTTSITATADQVLVTNRVGATSRAVLTSSDTIVLVDWGNITGTRTGGKILWSNGTVWDSFDFNALDAVFADLKTFPFPATV